MSDPNHRVLAMPRFLAERASATPTACSLHDQALPLRGLSELRHAAGLTIADLAIRTGLTTTLLARCEARAHAPSPRTIAALASALGVEAARLFEASPVPLENWLPSQA